MQRAASPIEKPPSKVGGFVRDLFSHGWSATLQERKTLPLIQNWSWPFWGEAPANVPVHVLTGARDWQLAHWMLASWFHFTETGWRIVIHDDGTLPPDAVEVLQHSFPGIRIISRQEADETMRRALLPFPFCHDHRQAHPLALKIFDMPHFASDKRFLVFDSDLMFFSPPREILEWTKKGADSCWFNEDAQEHSLLSASEAREELGVKLWSRVDSGLCLLGPRAIDFDFCDRALAETSLLSGEPRRIGQTLFALCASRRGEGGLLPARYEVSPRGAVPADAVSRHFTTADRSRIFSEGLKRLGPILLNEEKW